MATRAFIGKVDKDGIRAIYCHDDGFIEYAGRVLFESYKDRERVDSLIGLGDLLRLGEDIGGEYEREGACIAYGRNRKAKNTEARLYSSLNLFVKEARKDWAAYIYLYADGKWLVSVGDEHFVQLQRELLARG